MVFVTDPLGCDLPQGGRCRAAWMQSAPTADGFLDGLLDSTAAWGHWADGKPRPFTSSSQPLFSLAVFPAWPVGTLGSPSSFLIKPHACVLRSFCSWPFPEAREARTTPAVGVQLAGRGGRQAAPRNVFCLIYSNNVSFSFWLSSKPLIRLLWPQTAKRRLRQMG